MVRSYFEAARSDRRRRGPLLSFRHGSSERSSCDRPPRLRVCNVAASGRRPQRCGFVADGELVEAGGDCPVAFSPVAATFGGATSGPNHIRHIGADGAGNRLATLLNCADSPPKLVDVTRAALLDLHGRTLALALWVGHPDETGVLTSDQGRKITAMVRKGR